MKFVFKSLYFLIIQLKAQINKVYLKILHVQYGEGLKLHGWLFVRNRGNIQIGKFCKINSNIASNPVGGPYRSSLVANSGSVLSIGSHVGMSGTAIVCSEKITVEDNVFIGSGCCIFDTDFHSIDYASRVSTHDDTVATKPVMICEGAFIGARSIILKGVTIGKHSVIGAGSVVTKDVPENQLWAGNPARYIRDIIK